MGEMYRGRNFRKLIILIDQIYLVKEYLIGNMMQYFNTFNSFICWMCYLGNPCLELWGRVCLCV